MKNIFSIDKVEVVKSTIKSKKRRLYICFKPWNVLKMIFFRNFKKRFTLFDFFRIVRY